MRLPRTLCLLLLLSVCCPLTQAQPISTLQVSNPRVREAPPGATVHAGYMEFVNTSESTMTIDAVSSPDFDAAEIHRTVIDKGVAKMLPVEELNIPASKSITLEPGGLHLMLLGAKHPVRAGETITIIIHLSDGNPYTVSAPVIRMSGDDHSHHH